MAAEGRRVSVWQIQGEEVPVDSDGRKGVGRLWQSENFAIEVDP